MAESEPLNSKPRPIIRIVLFIISHSLLVSAICCIAGVLALLLLPVLAKNTYISENALMPGSASTMLSNQDVFEANRFVDKILSINLKPESTGIEIHGLIAQHIVDLGGEVTYHNFHPQLNKFHPLHFFSSPGAGRIQENYSCSSYGVSTTGIIRAPRGDGKEAIVLVTPYNAVKTTVAEAISIGIAYSVFSLLSRVTWLAKDIIWLAADSQHGEYASVSTWLRDYHAPLFGGLENKEFEMCQGSTSDESKMGSTTRTTISKGFRRAGTIATALVVKVGDGSDHVEKDAISIFAEASNGQMPNLDLINVVNYLAVRFHGLRVKVAKVWYFLNLKWINSLGELLESIGKVAGSLNPQWRFGISAAEYIEGTATLASSLYNQALGVPTGSHGAFRDYQVDAITLEMPLTDSANYKAKRSDFLLQRGRLVEGVIRSVNNLLEKFHQSFFLYLLTSPSRFVSVGVYMIAFVLLVAPLPVVSASLYLDANIMDSSSGKDKLTCLLASDVETASTIVRSWEWLHAAKRVFVIHLWGAVVALLPYFICQMPDFSSTASLSIWVILSVFSYLILQLILGSSFSFISVSQPKVKDWALLKSVTVSAAFIGLCLMSVINFATAELGALLMVPMCLMTNPLRSGIKVERLSHIVRANLSVILVFIGFPPSAFFLVKGALEGFGGISVGDFWNWAESLWAWNSATYIYICMVHLPCWALCIQILMHRS